MKPAEIQTLMIVMMSQLCGLPRCTRAEFSCKHDKIVRASLMPNLKAMIRVLFVKFVQDDDEHDDVKCMTSGGKALSQ
jgi:hypothetical protein